MGGLLPKVRTPEPPKPIREDDVAAQRREELARAQRVAMARAQADAGKQGPQQQAARMLLGN